MYRIIDKRGTGKTGRLFLIAKDTGATIVCSNPRMMQEKALRYGFKDLNFMSYAEYVEAYKGRGYNQKFLIDEIESLVKCLGNVIGYSLSEDEE